MGYSDIEIKTPIGPILLPTNELYDFITRVNADTKKEAGLKHQHIFDFFDPVIPDNEFFLLSPKKVSAYMKCIWDILHRDYDILQIKEYGGKGQYEIPVTYKEFDVDKENQESIPINATIFVKDNKSGEKSVFSFLPFSDGEGHHIEIEVFFDSSKTNFRQIWDNIDDYFKTEGPLKGEKFDTNWKYIDYQERDWDSIVLNKETYKLVNRNIINFIDNMEEYKKIRLPTSRGVLITGPPGTGKTLCCETIMSLVDCTIIYVTSDTVESVGDIKEIYKLARKLSPTIIVIEDIDTLGGLDRRDKGSHPLLGEFLNCLNGVGINDGVITIATTNYPENLDNALADRPGRFDLRINFDLPNSELREHILEKYLSEVTEEKLELSSLIRKTDGLSGAYLREIVITAYMISLEQGTTINQDILEQGVDAVLDLKENIRETYGTIKLEEGLYS